MTDARVDPSRWILRLTGEAAPEARLICFPHAGGGASTFRPWCEMLRPEVAVYGAQLPGREERVGESPARSLDEILQAIVAALAPLDNRPLVLFGHSMGAVLAFEVARRLQSVDLRQPFALVVSGRPAPHLPSRAPRLGELSALELVRRVAELYRGVPEAVLEDDALAALMGRALHADFAVLEAYRHEVSEPLTCSISAFGGEEDPWVSEEELDAWRAQTRASFSSARLRGDHFYFKSGASQQVLLAHLRERCLAAARREGE